MFAEHDKDSGTIMRLRDKINAGLVKHLTERRSVSANALQEPGPDADELAAMLRIAARVPDHKKLAPWRFVLFQGDARAAFGDILARRCAELEPDASAVRLETERTRFLRSPLVVVVISSPVETPAVPEWEQILSAGAVCLNLLHAAHAYGFAGNWITEWYAYDEGIRAALGLAPHERVAGFVYIGSPKEKPTERERPDITAIARPWSNSPHG